MPIHCIGTYNSIALTHWNIQTVIDSVVGQMPYRLSLAYSCTNSFTFFIGTVVAENCTVDIDCGKPSAGTGTSCSGGWKLICQHPNPEQGTQTEGGLCTCAEPNTCMCICTCMYNSAKIKKVPVVHFYPDT